jgi:hypothetical protein
MITKYIVSDAEQVPAAIIADKATRHMAYGKKMLTVLEVTCLIERGEGWKRVTVIDGASTFYVVPSRKSDVSLGIATHTPSTPVDPLTDEVADALVTNLAPLTHAVRSGATVSPKQFEEAVLGTDAIVSVRPGRYDSLKHPGDSSWVSADHDTVLSWWGGARYCTNASFLAGTDYAVSTTDTGSEATSELSEVIDGTMPVVTTPSYPSAVDGYSWGRTVPNLLHYYLWKNGAVFRKNCPGLAHALHDNGHTLYSLWGDLVQAEDYVMIRPYVRIEHTADPAVNGDTAASYVNTLWVGATFGVRLPSGALEPGAYLLADDTGTQYHFYGRFDETERTLHLYGVHMTDTSSVPTNGVHSFLTTLSNAELGGEVTVAGSTRTVSSSSSPYVAPTDPAVSDSITWGPLFMHPDSNWLNDGTANRSWTSRVGWNRLATGEYITRTLVADTAATITVDRTDDELLPCMESPLSVARAVAVSHLESSESVRVYTEVGVDRKARIVPAVGVLEESFGFSFSTSSGTAQPSRSGGFFPDGSKTVTTHIYADNLSGLDHTNTTTSAIGYIEWQGEQTWETIIAGAMSAVGFDGEVAPGAPSGPSGWGLGANWIWLSQVTWIRRETVSGELIAEAAARVVPSANNLTGVYGSSPCHFTVSFTNVPDYGLYNTSINLSRIKSTKHVEAQAVRTELTFGSMPPVQFDNFYTGVFDRSSWYEADGTTEITRRSEGSVTIDVQPIPVVIGYGDLRWPIAQQMTVAPWECMDSGYSFKPGRVLLEYSSDLAGNSTSTSTFEEIVFDPEQSLLGAFAEDVLTTIPTEHTIEDTYASRPEFISHDDYEQRFYAATQIQTSLVGNYPGVPSVTDVSGPLPASSLNGLEYFYHYDVDPAHTVLFGLPYTPETGDTRPRTWLRPDTENPSGPTPVRVAIDGLWDDGITYNSPIFVKKL